MNRYIRNLLAVLCTFVLVVLVAGCGCSSPKAEEGQETAIDSEEAPVVVQPEEKLMTIETDYGNLYYPAKWADYLTIEKQDMGEQCNVIFTATFGEVAYPLFTIQIGSGDGTGIGSIYDAQGVGRDVYVSMPEGVDESALSDAEKDQLLTMREDVNALIDKLEQ